jgi:hypothetical protein
MMFRDKLLSDLTFPLATGGSRRIGDKMSSRIYHFIYGHQESTLE